MVIFHLSCRVHRKIVKKSICMLQLSFVFCIRATYGVEKEDGGMFTVKVPRVMLESRKDKDDFPNISPPVGMV